MTNFYDYFLKCDAQEQADTLLESAGLQAALLADSMVTPTTPRVIFG